MLYAFLGGWVPRDDGCCTLFQVGGSPDGGKGTVTYLPWERNATLALPPAFNSLGVPLIAELEGAAARGLAPPAAHGGAA